MIPSAYQALKVIDECDEPPLPRCLEGIKTSWEIPSKKGGQLSLFGSQKKIHLKKNHQFFEEPSPPPKKKTSLIFDSSTSNLVLQHRQRTAKTLWISPLSTNGFYHDFFHQWFILSADETHLWHCRRWRRVCSTLLPSHGKWRPTYSTSFHLFENVHNDFLQKFKKKQLNCNTETQEKEILKSLNPENDSLIFSNSKIYKFLPKRKASVLVVSHFFKSKLLNHLRFF